MPEPKGMEKSFQGTGTFHPLSYLSGLSEWVSMWVSSPYLQTNSLKHTGQWKTSSAFFSRSLDFPSSTILGGGKKWSHERGLSHDLLLKSRQHEIQRLSKEKRMPPLLSIKNATDESFIHITILAEFYHPPICPPIHLFTLNPLIHSTNIYKNT